MNDGHKKARVGSRAIEVLQMSLQTITGNLFNGRNSTPTDASTQKQTPADTRPDRHTNHLLDLPKRVGYGVERIKLTPELAQHYLTFNRENRGIIQVRVAAYADEIARGEWAENGETLKFSKSHKMIDGQHRCLAVIKAATPIHVLVAYGMEDEVMAKIDIGKTRTASDVLSIQGLTRWDSRVAGSAAHAVINRMRGLPLTSAVKRLNREVETFFLEFPDFEKSIRFISSLSRKLPPIPHAKALVLHYLFAQKDVASADMYMEKLFSGDSLSKSNPIYHLREKLSEAQRGGKPFRSREQYHAAIKAWNYIRAQKSLASARTLFPRSDEQLPEIE